MSTYPHDALLATSVNGGGVFLVEHAGIERLSRIDTTGVTPLPGGFLFARQAEGRAELRRLFGRDVQRITLVERSLDVHDLLSHDDRIFVVCTELNMIFELDANFAELRHWTFSSEPDSQHVNSVCIHEGRLLASRFGRFERRRGYKGMTRGAGEVFDVESGEVVISGLSQPHSLKSVDGRLWLCDSETYTLRTYRDFVIDGEYRFDGYTRGLAFGAAHVYVGLSRSRNDPEGRLPSARIVVLDLSDMSEVHRIELAADEIYDLCPVGDVRLSTLRAAALADANAEFDTLAHERNLARAEAARLEQKAASQTHELLTLRTQAASQSAQIDQAREDLARMTADAQATAVWTEMLETDNADLRRLIESGEGYIARQAAALQAWRTFAESVAASRSWRSTRWLRRIDPALPAPFDEILQPPVDVRAADRANVPIFGLEFEEHEAPTVSIVVTAYGKFEATLECLRSIRRASAHATFEVVLIEDCSGERDMERFRSVPGLRYYANPENLGFLRSASQATRLARGDYIHLLNNDTQVTAGWLDALLRTFGIFPDCGMAGSRLVYPDGRLQEVGGIVWSDGDACNHGRGAAGDDPAYGCVREVDYVSGAAVLLPTALFRSLDGFDERYLPAYYEDTDLAFRIRECGRKVYVQPASTVVHVEGLSHGVDPHSGIKASQPANREVFLVRWRETLAREQLPPGRHLFLAKDRAQLKKSVLIVDRRPPHTDQDAGSRAIWQLMRVLHLQGFSIKFWADEAERNPAYVHLLEMHGIELLNATDPDAEFDAWIAAHGCYIDHVVLSRPLVAEKYIDSVRRRTASKVLYYGHDVHHVRIERQFALTGEQGLRAHARHLQSVEEGLWRESDLILYPTDEETQHVNRWLEAAGHSLRASTIPLFAYEDIPPLLEGPDHRIVDRHDVVFVGGFAHAPNEDAALWFTREVWPHVHLGEPSLRLCLVGSDPSEALRALAGPGVLVTGYVSESALIEHYNRARVAVAPLRFGSGMKGKIIEAMRFGVPCVTTTTGAQGFSGADFLRVADDPREMAAQILDLVGRPDAWRVTSGDGQAFVRERFSVPSVWNVLATVMDPTPYPDVDDRLGRLAVAPAARVTGEMPPERQA